MRLQAHGAETLHTWLECLGRDTRLQDWQLRRRVGALRLLFCCLLARPWAMDLGADHPSVIRAD